MPCRGRASLRLLASRWSVPRVGQPLSPRCLLGCAVHMCQVAYLLWRGVGLVQAISGISAFLSPGAALIGFSGDEFITALADEMAKPALPSWSAQYRVNSSSLWALGAYYCCDPRERDRRTGGCEQRQQPDRGRPVTRRSPGGDGVRRPARGGLSPPVRHRDRPWWTGSTTPSAVPQSGHAVSSSRNGHHRVEWLVLGGQLCARLPPLTGQFRVEVLLSAR